MDVELEEARIIRDLSGYFRARRELEKILKAYDAGSVEELRLKIEAKELPEHPTYEDYLEASSYQQDLEEMRKRLRYALKELGP